jgi:wingless-type MMTV integration site family protein 11
MASSYIVIVVAVSSHVMTSADAIEWLVLSKSRSYWNRTVDCTAAGPLAATQRGLCSRNLDLMPYVAHAARLTTNVCQEQFADKRWNCSSVLLAPNFTPDLTKGSREQAFVSALASASLVQSVAKACSSGQVSKCGCGRLPVSPLQQPASDHRQVRSASTAVTDAGPVTAATDGDFKWGGCSDNIVFGNEFARQFADGRWTPRGQRRQLQPRKYSKQAYTNLHNNMAGRKIAVDSMTTTCKCHGVSGSCSIRTCWRALLDARQIGATVMKSYIVAVEVTAAGRRRQQSAAGDRRQLMPAAHTGRTNFTVDDLIFYTQSPDYCVPEVSLGSVGTKDRMCLKDNPGSGGCQSMCCGRGFWTQTTQVQHRCDCKYYWCCYVKCKTCTKTVDINRCR